MSLARTSDMILNYCEPGNAIVPVAILKMMQPRAQRSDSMRVIVATFILIVSGAI